MMQKNRQVKVCLVIESLAVGGKERRLIQIANKMSEKGLDVIIIVYSDKNYYIGDIATSIKVHCILRRYKKDLKPFISTFKIFREFRPDIVHTFGFLSTLFAIFAAKLMGIKVVNGMITNARDNISVGSYVWLQDRITFSFSDCIMANSKAGLIAHNAPLKKSEFIHNGYDFKKDILSKSTLDLKAKYSIETPYVVSMVAALTDLKDHNTFVAAAKVILSMRNDVTFLCVGSGPNFDAITDSTKDIAQRFLVLGSIRDVGMVYRASTITVLATYTEGLPNVILESMSQGVPVIATDGGGVSEIVIDNFNGLLISVSSVKQLIESILKLINSQKKRDELSRNALEHVKNNFDLSIKVEEIINVYSKLTPRGRT